MADEVDICLDSDIVYSLEFSHPTEEYFSLSWRATNALKIAGVNTFSAFKNLDVSTLKNIEGVGKKTIAEIAAAKSIVDSAKTLEETKYQIGVVRNYIKAIKENLAPLIAEEQKLKIRIADIEKWLSV